VRLIVLLVALCATPAFAQSKSEVILLARIQAQRVFAHAEGPADRQEDDQRVADPVGLGNHKFEILRRDGSGAGEQHNNWTDIFIVQGGEGTILYGGSIPDAKDTGNGEIRGPKHVGGTSQKVTAGDVLVMPPGVPHQTIVEPGKNFFVLIVKVEKK
jgi:mannose-6-phosphate isomerase-like protein (cupin superfamily)